MTHESVQTTYDRSAAEFDRARRQLVPDFDRYYGTVLELLPEERTTSIRILDLGAGTGLLSKLILEAFPAAVVTLVDISDEMLKRARDRLAEYAMRVRYITGDYTQTEWDGPYDAVVSAISIHHIDDDAKQQLFASVYEVLGPKGIFINADQVQGDTPEIQARYHDAWLQQVLERGINNQDLHAALERMKEDKLTSLDNQLHWLRNTGFHSVNCWYQNYSLVVYSGTKS